jgi:glycerophosphoryl diester phosphodiesterase
MKNTHERKAKALSQLAGAICQATPAIEIRQWQGGWWPLVKEVVEAVKELVEIEIEIEIEIEAQAQAQAEIATRHQAKVKAQYDFESCIPDWCRETLEEKKWAQTVEEGDVKTLSEKILFPLVKAKKPEEYLREEFPESFAFAEKVIAQSGGKRLEKVADQGRKNSGEVPCDGIYPSGRNSSNSVA